jgi:DNA-directed RNA polymerase specialized sigma24 family protein
MTNNRSDTAPPSQGDPEDARQRQPVPVGCGAEPDPADVCVCPYIHDQELPGELLRRVRACAWAITHDHEGVKEVEQQVKMKLSTLDRKRWDEEITRKWGYVIRIAQNESRTWLQREARQRGNLTSRKPHEPEGKLMERAIPDWDIKELKRLLEPLGHECAEVFIRVWIFGHAVRTVALKMKLPVSRVQAHLNAARLYYLNLMEGDPKVPSLFDRLVSLFPRRRS